MSVQLSGCVVGGGTACVQSVSKIDRICIGAAGFAQMTSGSRAFVVEFVEKLTEPTYAVAPSARIIFECMYGCSRVSGAGIMRMLVPPAASSCAGGRL